MIKVCQNKYVFISERLLMNKFRGGESSEGTSPYSESNSRQHM